MLATGRAVVACASPHTQGAQVVSGRGCVVPPGDEAAFTEAIEALAAAPARRLELGRAARRYAAEHLGRTAILTRFLEQLRNLVRPGTSMGVVGTEGTMEMVKSTEDRRATLGN